MSSANAAARGLRALFAVGLAGILCACQFPIGSGQQRVKHVQNPCVVLALPASGPYASVARRVKQGAEMARASLKAQGIDVSLRDIDTAATDWLARLNALPETCVVVGGPLQDKKYIEARKASATSQRVFFSFLGNLGEGDEGTVAWRFFPGAQDQIDALVGFATDQMGIRTYGAFYPADNYGRRMTALLEKNLAKRHISLEKAAYNLGAPATWAASAKSLIKPRLAEDGQSPLPQTSFEALFVPDSWKHMDGITKALASHGEDRLALLGTNIWEQGMATAPRNVDRYALAVFPLPWNRANPPAALRKGADFWMALGYDFMDFAGKLGLASRPDAATVATLAQNIAPGLKALAPLNWDNAGVLRQRMHICQITANGIAPVNVERFRKARMAAAERAALRMQGFGHINPDTGEVMEARPAEAAEDLPQTQPAAATGPVTEEAATPKATPAPMPTLPAGTPGVMSTTPRPSYKLSLPQKR